MWLFRSTPDLLLVKIGDGAKWCFAAFPKAKLLSWYCFRDATLSFATVST
jgi:hypothetical protein